MQMVQFMNEENKIQFQTDKWMIEIAFRWFSLWIW